MKAGLKHYLINQLVNSSIGAIGQFHREYRIAGFFCFWIIFFVAQLSDSDILPDQGRFGFPKSDIRSTLTGCQVLL